MTDDFTYSDGRFFHRFDRFELSFEPMIFGGWFLALYEYHGEEQSLLWKSKMELDEPSYPKTEKGLATWNVWQTGWAAMLRHAVEGASDALQEPDDQPGSDHVDAGREAGVSGLATG